MYLPVSICNGAVPPLNRASRDLWGFILTFWTYSSVSPYSVLKLMYDLNFGLVKTSACHLSFSRRKRQQVTTCWSSLCESPSQELWCHQDCRAHSAKIFLTWLAQLSWFCLSASLLHSMYTFLQILLLSLCTRCHQNATVASLCLHEVGIQMQLPVGVCYWLQESTYKLGFALSQLPLRNRIWTTQTLHNQYGSHHQAKEPFINNIRWTTYFH